VGFTKVLLKKPALSPTIFLGYHRPSGKSR
jgi:hypothetical protein